MLNPSIVMELHKYRNLLIKDGNMPASMALLIWILTFRAAATPELRIYGKRMWDEIRRGQEIARVPAGLDSRR